MNRREYLMLVRNSAVAATALLSGRVDAQEAEAPRIIDLQRDRERYRIDITTREGYQTAAYLMRDMRTRRTGLPDGRLLALLAWGQAAMRVYYGRETVLVLTSAMREHHPLNPVEGTSRSGFHVPDPSGRFKAVDLDPVGVHRDTWGAVMSRLGYGGVGFYRSHVHIDSGPPRRVWDQR